MAKKLTICGRKTKKYYILGYKGKAHRGTYHRIPAKSLLEAKAKMLKGTRYQLSDIKVYKGKEK